MSVSDAATTTTYVAPLRARDIDHRAAAVGAMVVGAVALGVVAAGGVVDPAAGIMGAGGLVLAAGGDRARAALHANPERSAVAYVRAWGYSLRAIRGASTPQAWGEVVADPHDPAPLVQIVHACVQQIGQLVRLRRAQRRAQRR